MSEVLRSVGLDIGTTSTQMVVSRLTIENRASAFAVPELEIAGREILYRSPVHFTPLLDESRMDAEGLRQIVEAEYRKAGITRDTVDTGAIIITGETSRKENARAVLAALADLAGDFVVATAGPDLESVLAAKGAGAVDDSRETGADVLHMDIGGGTSNLCLIRGGNVIRTGCLNVGGRLVKRTAEGEVTYVSPVLAGLTALRPGDRPGEEALKDLAGVLTRALEMAAGLRPAEGLLERLGTHEAARPWTPPEGPVKLSFSGGVAECVRQDYPLGAFGDIGPALGRAIRGSALCRGEYRLESDAIRATVIGAGCHSTQLSGSTVYYQNVRFPKKNVPVTGPGDIPPMEEQTILALPGISSPSYRETVAMAEDILDKCHGPLLLCLERDMAKALGQALAARSPRDREILCIDRVRVPAGSYLDIGAPVGEALPVVVKTLVLGEKREAGSWE